MADENVDAWKRQAWIRETETERKKERKGVRNVREKSKKKGGMFHRSISLFPFLPFCRRFVSSSEKIQNVNPIVCTIRSKPGSTAEKKNL